MNADRQYAEGGKQPAASYELSDVIKEQLTLEPAALWVNNDTLKFFSPKNPAHVSHSLVNLHNVGAPDAVYIEVPAITYAELVEKNSLKDVPLVKMDIEGAETVVITQMMNAGHRPRQLLIEYDELLHPSAEAKSSVEDCHHLLIKCGYRCRYCDGTSNFLYIHDLPQS
jgi:FkbM family methyltransferase